MFNETNEFDKLFNLIMENLNKFSVGNLFDGINIQQKSNNIQQSLIDFKLITLFYNTFKTNKNIWKQTDTVKKFLSITFPEQIFIENKINQLIQLNQIDLIVLD